MTIFKHSTKAVAAVVLSSMLLGGVAYAKHDEHKRGGFGGKHQMHKLSRVLDLTDEQKTQIKAIFEQHKADKQSGDNQLAKDYHLALTELTYSQNYSDQAVRDLYLQYQDVFVEKTVKRANLEHQINAVLTPEQIEKKKALKAKFDRKKRDGKDRDRKDRQAKESE
ncbi:Spy/CpxP family protein refolding chaperone [Catenovulum sp. 2E275]|uniref:Spy/CpxP family protein refolding chaperone n=1 Tax=Catenovulum sp. 2E275 TaxID=2980497 RepID=UPI0021D20EAA|nr:Spy/CpxP family protein refolding chaperone [Catenovulum sp. 2E275]MCU4674479.1 Spy/CpxP family protein refolding chaperone [Catenovulum sp. 2E275]